MAQPYLGEIRMFAGNFAPSGWAFCHGQVLSIGENADLFGLIGTTYGGDGQRTFALPDLRGRVPIHVGAGHQLGEQGGSEAVTLLTSQLPEHVHSVLASAMAATTGTTLNNVPAAAGSTAGARVCAFADGAPSADMSAAAVSVVGGAQPHENRMPYLPITFIIALSGSHPSPS